jgi:hypothetical protein
MKYDVNKTISWRMILTGQGKVLNKIVEVQVRIHLLSSTGRQEMNES